MSAPPSPADSDSIIPLAREISGLYPRHFMRHYTYWKIRTDPVYPQAFQHLSHSQETPLVDLGCGAGLFALYLRKRGYSGSIHGLDLDPRKIIQARSIASPDSPFADIAFDTGNFNQWTPADYKGHVTLLDVLQYLPEGEQLHLLRTAASCLKQSHHRLILRNALRDESWRSKVTVGTDHFAHWVRWMQNQPTFYPSKALIQNTLESAGLLVHLQPLWGGTPFNNYLIVAHRPD